jgi:uncharacterized membrane protein
MPDNHSSMISPKKSFLPDNLKLGLLLGFLTPMICLVIYYYWKVSPNSWSTFFNYLFQEKRLLSSLTVICLLPNIALFTLFINTQRDKTAKGIFAFTVVFAIASLLFKFLV